MCANRPGEKRRAKRFEIDCPVTVGLRRKGNGQAVGQGRLHDVAVRGARFYLSRPLEIGSSVVLQIHFRDLNESVTTVRFEGTVMRVGEKRPYEIAVRFRRGGRFLRGDLEDLTSVRQTA